MNILTRTTSNTPPPSPETILQFGGGNFLRGFVDWIIEEYNQKTGANLGVLVVKPTERGDYQKWRDQEGLFHVLNKGIKNGQLVDEVQLVSCVSRIIHPYREWDVFLKSAENPSIRYIISNTTENGIRTSPKDQLSDAPPGEFPAKLTSWLYHRFKHFNGSKEAGCVIIPTELLVDNGKLLKACILEYSERWQLGNNFENWLNDATIFCNTLVDRIIPGIAKKAREREWQNIGFQDNMITSGEPYHLWVIEAPQPVREELPLDKIGLNVVYTDDVSPYRTTKVRILNGAHTSMVPVGYLAGIETVREAVEDELMGKFIRQLMFEEIIPSMDLSKKELEQFGEDVLDRFKNPFIKHHLITISLNSISKIKARILPSILGYYREKGALPKRLVFAFAAMIRFYKGEFNGQQIPLKDDTFKIDFLQKLWSTCDDSKAGISQLVQSILEWAFWDMELSTISDLRDLLTEYLFKLNTRANFDDIKKLIQDVELEN